MKRSLAIVAGFTGVLAASTNPIWENKQAIAQTEVPMRLSVPLSFC